MLYSPRCSKLLTILFFFFSFRQREISQNGYFVIYQAIRNRREFVCENKGGGGERGGGVW